MTFFDITPHSIFVDSCAEQEVALISRAFGTTLHTNQHFLMVMDENGYYLIGEKLIDILKSHCRVTAHVLPTNVAPNETLATMIAQSATESHVDGYIAIGSGTINDLTKFAAHTAQKPYMIFATAPSMNGYLSSNASMIAPSGKRFSFAATMPTLVVCDMTVLHHAPIRMKQAGLGDALCRSTAQLDWLLSHLLLGTAYEASIYESLRASESILCAATQTSLEDTVFTRALMENLLISGLGMTQSGGSHPASQAEHMLAHNYETYMHHTHTASPQPNLHGEEIAVTCFIMAQRQAQILAREVAPHLLPMIPDASTMRTMLGDEIAFSCVMDYDMKRERITLAQDIETKLHTSWKDISAQLLTHHLPPQTLQQVFTSVGLRTTPEELGWDSTILEKLIPITRFTRDRFTFLDIE